MYLYLYEYIGGTLNLKLVQPLDHLFSSFIFPPLKVWSQGGFEAEYGAEDRFQRCCDSNPTLLHNFLASSSVVFLF